MKKRFAVGLALAAMLAIPGLAAAQEPGGSATPTTPAPTTPAPATPAPATPAPATPAADTTKPNSPSSSIASQSMMMTTPPEELKKLAILAGSWKTKMHVFESPMGPESNSTGKVTYKWSPKKMHLEGDHQFTVGGKPVMGQTIWGWDPDKKQYQAIWTDDMSSTSLTYYGTFATENTLVLFTTLVMNGKAVTEKITYTFPSKDASTFTLENDMSGQMQKIMEQTSTKVVATSKKAPAKKTVASAPTKKS